MFTRATVLPVPPTPVPPGARAAPAWRSALGWAVAGLAACALAGCGDAETRYHAVAFSRTDGVAARPDGAANVDDSVVDPVGMRVSRVGTWTANRGTGTLTFHNRDGVPLPHGAPLAVRLPVPEGMEAGAVSRPTGMVYNHGRSLIIESGDQRASARLILATEEGTILGYSSTVSQDSAVLAVDRSAEGASYRGLAIARRPGGVRLYATNFAAGSIEAYDDEFQPDELDASAFEDPELASGFSPFGIRRIGRTLYVSYAERDAETSQPVAGRGKGVVNAFGLDGRFRGRIASGAPLNMPWGMARAPLSLPYFGGLLIVANHGNGRIHAFEPHGGGFVAAFVDADLRSVAIEGLWDVSFGRNFSDRNSALFTAGGEGPDDGVVGRLDPALVRTDPPSDD